MNNQEAIQACQAVLRRFLSLIDPLSEEQYRAEVLGESSIGTHLRHSLDHFFSFFKGLETGCCDYDNRERNEGIEQCLETAKEQILKLIERLDDLAHNNSSRFEISQLYHCESPELKMSSTIERELMFLMHHTVHHVAISSVLLKAQGSCVDPRLALAFATEKELIATDS